MDNHTRKKESNHKLKSGPGVSAPLLRLRHLVLIVAGIALLFLAPVLIVWKQVYITQSSVSQRAVADSIAVLTKEVTRLRFTVEKLSANGRIESIARERLGLEYPMADRIVIMHEKSVEAVMPATMTRNVITALRKAVSRGRG
jgi:cell division protein FtsL